MVWPLSYLNLYGVDFSLTHYVTFPPQQVGNGTIGQSWPNQRTWILEKSPV